MDDPIWISKELVLAIHSRQIAEHGGADGTRDEGLLDSALARPRNHFAYTDPTPGVPALAAAYAFGIARNHAFIDGNGTEKERNGKRGTEKETASEKRNGKRDGTEKETASYTEAGSSVAEINLGSARTLIQV